MSGKSSSKDPKDQDNNSSKAPNKKTKKGHSGRILLIGCLVSIVLVLCCVISGSLYYLFFIDTPNPKDNAKRVDPTKINLTTEDFVELTDKNITSEGGKITGTYSPNSDKSITVEIGENFLEEDENISVGYKPIEQAENLPQDTKVIGDVIVLNKENPDLLFKHPVSVTVSYDKSQVTNGEGIYAFGFNSETGELESTTLIDHDPQEGTIQFLTTHFSEFLLIELEKALDDIFYTDYDTGFRPVSYGWFIENWGTYITDGGNCLGMSAISQYVYSHPDTFNKDFYEALREGDPDNQLDDKIANELAGRTQMALGNRWNTLSADLDRFDKLDQPKPSSMHGQAILSNFYITGKPQVLYVMTLWKENTPDGDWKWSSANQHAVLTYKYENGKFSIYNPNYPYRAGKTAWDQSVDYSWDKGFGIYDTGITKYNYVRHIGPNLITSSNIISNLLGMAKNGFPDDEFPNITISSPQDDMTTTEKSVVVTGTVDGWSYLNNADEAYMHYYYQNENGGLEHVRSAVNFADTSTDFGGSFEQELPLIAGENTINILAAGKQPDDEWAGWESIKVNASIKPADMIATLTWSKGQSDIDLHVTDPLGNHVWYMAMNAPTGANLDFDNTFGYGPEHYTISSAEGDEMPYGEYDIEVVYYADHDDNYDTDQAVPWTVNIRWVKMIIPSGENGEENQKIWEDVTRTGILRSSGEKQQVYTINYAEPTQQDFEIVANPFGAK
jgi:uncharacterized protein YfaP (DUF2135 family)